MPIGETSTGGAQKGFPQTVWDLVSRAQSPTAQVRRGGLEEFFRRYWKPVYHHIRVAWDKPNEEAKDLTQAFFLWIFEDDALKRYAPERASFRAYLKSLLRHFVQDPDKALYRLKRGGGVRIVSLDGEIRPLKGVLEDAQGADPERVFDHAWRVALMEHAVERVRERFRSGEKAPAFRVFEAYDLALPGERPTYAALAKRLGLSESDVHHALSAVRAEVRSEIRAELARMTATPEQLEEEWNAFLGA
jgi:RNA polymerase sigma-70 factor (ECF subfamily)